ncbi:hypothetical protein LX36DRAFT_483943 [Colletotrichum falcatum]|nr:hypothetical protein LX36DRAFT_483943 [Colletotrichum falcatum]
MKRRLSGYTSDISQQSTDNAPSPINGKEGRGCRRRLASRVVQPKRSTSHLLPPLLLQLVTRAQSLDTEGLANEPSSSAGDASLNATFRQLTTDFPPTAGLKRACSRFGSAYRQSTRIGPFPNSCGQPKPGCTYMRGVCRSIHMTYTHTHTQTWSLAAFES